MKTDKFPSRRVALLSLSALGLGAFATAVFAKDGGNSGHGGSSGSSGGSSNSGRNHDENHAENETGHEAGHDNGDDGIHQSNGETVHHQRRRGKPKN